MLNKMLPLLLIISTCAPKNSDPVEGDPNAESSGSNGQSQVTIDPSVGGTATLDNMIKLLIPPGFSDNPAITVKRYDSDISAASGSTVVGAASRIQITDANGNVISDASGTYSVTFFDKDYSQYDPADLEVWGRDNFAGGDIEKFSDVVIEISADGDLVISGISSPDVEIVVVLPPSPPGGGPGGGGPSDSHLFHLVMAEPNLDPIHIYNDADDKWYAENLNSIYNLADYEVFSVDVGISIDKNNDVHVCWGGNDNMGNTSHVFHAKKQSGVWQSVNVVYNDSLAAAKCALVTIDDKPAMHLSSAAYGTRYENLTLAQSIFNNDWTLASLDLDIAMGNTASQIWAVTTRHRPFTYDPTVHLAVMHSSDGGANWAFVPSADHFHTSLGCPTRLGAIAADSSNTAYVVYVCDNGGSSNLRIAHSDNSWTEIDVPGTTGSISRRPNITIDDADLVHIVYELSGDLFYRTYNGTTFSSPITVEASANAVRSPQISVGADSVVHIFYILDSVTDKVIHAEIREGVLTENEGHPTAKITDIPVAPNASLGNNVGHEGIEAENFFTP